MEVSGDRSCYPVGPGEDVREIPSIRKETIQWEDTDQENR